MKLIKIFTSILAATFFLGWWFEWGYLIKAIQATYLQGHVSANIDDHDQFFHRIIPKGKTQPWPIDARYNKNPLPESLSKTFSKLKTISYLVVHKGKILTEHYYLGYGPHSTTNSFSMAKTVTTMLVGAAIADGIIKSFDEPIINYLPEYRNNPMAQHATLAHLSAMSAGHEWDENYYLPINAMTALYYGKDARKVIFSKGFERTPGTEFEYSSGTTQLLGIILERALKKHNPQMTISQYLSEKFWQPLGMDANGFMTLDDKNGLEKNYCCLFTSARNFAKLGQLLLQNGQWNGKTLLTSAFIDRMKKPDLQSFYGHSLWMDWQYKEPFYLMQGFLGQYVIVVPKHELVIVRLGHAQTPMPSDTDIPTEVYQMVDAAVQDSQKISVAIEPTAPISVNQTNISVPNFRKSDH